MVVEPFSENFNDIIELGNTLYEYGVKPSNIGSSLDIAIFGIINESHQKSNSINITPGFSEQREMEEYKVEYNNRNHGIKPSIEEYRGYYLTVSQKIAQFTANFKEEVNREGLTVDAESERLFMQEFIESLDNIAKMFVNRTKMQQEELERVIEQQQEIQQEAERIRRMEEYEEKKEELEKEKYMDKQMDSLARIFLPEGWTKDSSPDKANDLNKVKEAGVALSEVGTELANGKDSSVNRLVGRQQEHDMSITLGKR